MLESTLIFTFIINFKDVYKGKHFQELPLPFRGRESQQRIFSLFDIFNYFSENYSKSDLIFIAEEDVISFDEDTNMFPRKGRKHRDTAEVLKNPDNVVLEPILGEPGETFINKTRVVGINNKNGELFKEGVEKQEGGKPDVESGTEMFDEEVGPVRKLNQLIDFDLPEVLK